jgi:hypothetical protein
MTTENWYTRARRAALFIAVAMMAYPGGEAYAGITHDEASSGDLSGDKTAPTPLTFAEGSNVIRGTTTRDEHDLIAATIPIGFRLDAIFLDTMVGNLAFIAVQSGTVWTENLGVAITTAQNLLGWAHFGPRNNTLGTDILDDMGAGAGAIGFTAPLGAGDYTFLIQQTGGSIVEYGFRFEVSPVPEPVTAGTLLAGLAVIGTALRRRSRGEWGNGGEWGTDHEYRDAGRGIDVRPVFSPCRSFRSRRQENICKVKRIGSRE